MRTFAFALLAATAAGAFGVQTPPPQHHADVDRRGARVMGFDQHQTVHHFFLYEDGGAISVDVKNPSDTANLAAIRVHLPHVAMMFGEGNFEAPVLVHDTNVPGTTEMARLRTHVSYKYGDTALGGRVNIVTTDPDALAAVHAFLRFQIEDHRTGDSTAIRKR